MAGDLTLIDFRQQIVQLYRMGMKDIVSRMPGMSEMIPECESPEAALKRVLCMIDSMTTAEKHNPDIIDQGRRKRIATGCGVEPSEVKQFLTQFERVRMLMKQMDQMSTWERIKLVTGWGRLPRPK